MAYEKVKELSVLEVLQRKEQPTIDTVVCNRNDLSRTIQKSIVSLYKIFLTYGASLVVNENTVKHINSIFKHNNKEPLPTIKKFDKEVSLNVAAPFIDAKYYGSFEEEEYFKEKNNVFVSEVMPDNKVLIFIQGNGFDWVYADRPFAEVEVDGGEKIKIPELDLILSDLKTQPYFRDGDIKHWAFVEVKE